MYYIEVSMEGGTGRAYVESPTQIDMSGEIAMVDIKWSSPNYDYMKLGDEMYLPVNTEGNSEFIIPVEKFDEPIEMIADTTAMSTPHEINYSFTFHSDTLMEQKDTPMARARYSVYVAIVIMMICLFVSMHKKRKRKRLIAEMAKNDKN